MKLMCPYCGLKGTAVDTLLERNVRCPQCQKVFRLQQTDPVGPASGSPAVTAGSFDAQRLGGTGILERSDIGTCSVCGFSLSTNFLETKGDRVFCRICLPN